MMLLGVLGRKGSLERGHFCRTGTPRMAVVGVGLTGWARHGVLR
ncbi:hypothetical protein SAMN06265222_12612 [Neorhodopirellula lusitana]|uniref:Uncharacterized protein n=1 Tax=Neorhodopirellula lusitana TaxID=445327 RepID=A0ABY1QQY5_9BACT|nr:hypothetical protein SAMN06265222_12612 [Neorhodopirellula lusitana]